MADPEHFREYVVGRYAALVRTAWLLTGDFASAEDLVQVALLKAWRRWSTLRENPDAYVRRILVNTKITWWRRRSAGEEPSAVLPERVSDDQFQTVEARRDVMALLAGLPRQQRAVLVLRYYEDLSEEETAELLGCSVGTVKSHASRGLAALRLATARSDRTETMEGR